MFDQKFVTQGLVVLGFSALTTLGISSVQAATIDVGFALDQSGSIIDSDWTLMKNGLANALPSFLAPNVQDTFRVTVVKFGESAQTVVSPILLTNANLSNVQDDIRNALRVGTGATNFEAAINLLNTNITNAGGFDRNDGLINISTDGEPNTGNTDPNFLRNLAFNFGWDGMSAEAVGGLDTTLLQTLAFPTPVTVTNNPNSLPNPFDNGFVLEVDSFADYEAAIKAKVETITTTPEPSSLIALMAMGGLGLIVKRKKQS